MARVGLMLMIPDGASSSRGHGVFYEAATTSFTAVSISVTPKYVSQLSLLCHALRQFAATTIVVHSAPMASARQRQLFKVAARLFIYALHDLAQLGHRA